MKRIIGTLLILLTVGMSSLPHLEEFEMTSGDANQIIAQNTGPYISAKTPNSPSNTIVMNESHDCSHCPPSSGHHHSCHFGHCGFANSSFSYNHYAGMSGLTYYLSNLHLDSFCSDPIRPPIA